MYLDDGSTLVYVKDRCTPEDMVSFLFARVAPESPEALPAHRRRKGLRYEPLRGIFPERLGDRCLVGISLPTYPVDHIVTGQRAWRPEQGRLVRWTIWKAEAALSVVGVSESTVKDAALDRPDDASAALGMVEP